MAPELTTDRLRLRQWRESDVDDFHAFYRDPQSEAVYGKDTSRSDVWRRIALIIGHWHFRGYGLWALEDRASGTFAGYCGLWFPEGWDDPEIGWGITPQFRGQGYAGEAASRVRDFGFSDRKLARLVSYINPVNAASIRVAEKLGATRDGEFVMHGKPHHVYRHHPN
jgi:RimJ/RimL family protein N-acetyltransferase